MKVVLVFVVPGLRRRIYKKVYINEKKIQRKEEFKKKRKVIYFLVLSILKKKKILKQLLANWDMKYKWLIVKQTEMR